MTRDAIVVVDMQHYFCERGSAFLRFIAALGGDDEASGYLDRLVSTVVPNIAAVLVAARGRGELVVITEFGAADSPDGGLPPWARRHNSIAGDLIGEPIYQPLVDDACRTIAELAPAATDIVIPRSTSGPLAGTDIVEQLRARGIQRVVVTGVATDVCVTGWTRELADSGFTVAVPVDACASPLQRCHTAALELTIPAFAILTETRHVLMAVDR